MQNMKGVVKIIFAGAFLMGSSFALAQETSKAPPGSGPNPYRDCGIGAALFPDTHWAAVTSNVIWDIGTTAVTSATASPGTCNGKATKVAQFVVDTYAAVVDETAHGGGEHLTAMLEIYGCSVSEHAAIVAAVRPSVAALVAAPGYTQLSDGEKAEQYFLAVDSEVRVNHAVSCAI